MTPLATPTPSLSDRWRLFNSHRSVEITGELDALWDRAEQDWVLHEPMRFVWRVGMEIRFDFTVPADFHTDLSSIPRLARSIIPQVGPQNRPAVGHDYVCRGHVPGMSWFEGDLMFLDAMELDEVSTLRRWVMFGGVELNRIWLRMKGE